MLQTKFVFHIPHDGNAFPQALCNAVCVPKQQFLQYHNDMRDTGAHCFVPVQHRGTVLAFGVSRLLCDVERFTDGSEPMEQYGMGFCYERAYDGTQIKRVTPQLKAATLSLYIAHHAALDATVAGKDGRVFVVDLHSFSKKIIVRDTLKCNAPLPDICLGCDAFLPLPLQQACVQLCQAAGFSVAVNYPYAGSLVPNAVLQGKAQVPVASVMIEVNKRIYLHENTLHMAAVRKIQALVEAVCSAAEQTKNFS